MNVAVPARILYVDHTAALGGGEIALLNLVSHLDARRYRPVVLLFAEGPLATRLRQAGVETHVVPLASSVAKARKDSLGARSLLRVGDVALLAAHTLKLAGFMRRGGFSLVHANSLKADIIGGTAARIARLPVIWHVRDRVESDYLPGRVAQAFRLLARTLPDHVVANSAATLRTLRLPSHRCGDVVCSGLAVDAPPWPELLNRREVLPTGASGAWRPVIGLVGRITPWKGQHVFLRAAAAVRKRHPGARFRIIGSALFDEQAYEREVRALCTSLGLDDCVEFMGFRSDVPSLIAGFDVLVHASTTGEPFGQVVIEGMAAGKPVVATNGGGVPEIVVDGETGILVPMGDADRMADAIVRLLDDPAAAAEMGRRGRQRVLDHFTIRHAVEKVQGIYDRLLGRAPAGGPSSRRGSGSEAGSSAGRVSPPASGSPAPRSGRRPGRASPPGAAGAPSPASTR